MLPHHMRLHHPTTIVMAPVAELAIKSSLNLFHCVPDKAREHSARGSDACHILADQVIGLSIVGGSMTRDGEREINLLNVKHWIVLDKWFNNSNIPPPYRHVNTPPVNYWHNL